MRRHEDGREYVGRCESSIVVVISRPLSADRESVWSRVLGLGREWETGGGDGLEGERKKGEEVLTDDRNKRMQRERRKRWCVVVCVGERTESGNAGTGRKTQMSWTRVCVVVVGGGSGDPPVTLNLIHSPLGSTRSTG